MPRTPTHATLIIGAGFTGLGAAIKLKQAGLDGEEDIVILERSDRVGGTWRDTTYPGASCDIPSLLYSFSFVQEPRLVADLLACRRDLPSPRGPGDPFDLRRHIRFGQDVNGLSFDESSGLWTATTIQRKRFRARTVVLASGPLSEGRTFPTSGASTAMKAIKSTAPAGTTATTSPASGSASSAPEPAPCRSFPNWSSRADFVKVFQRTPGWVLPRLDVATPAAVQAVFAKVPVVQQVARQASVLGPRGQRNRAGMELAADFAGGATWAKLTCG